VRRHRLRAPLRLLVLIACGLAAPPAGAAVGVPTRASPASRSEISTTTRAPLPTGTTAAMRASSLHRNSLPARSSSSQPRII